MICEWMKSKWHADCYPSKHEKYYRIRFSKSGRNVFINLVESYIIPSLKYKLILPILTRTFINEDMVKEFISLRAVGESYQSIGNKFGFSHSGIFRSIKRFQKHDRNIH